MGRLIDLTGQRFGRLVVVERAENVGKNAAWICKCDCGKQVVSAGFDLVRGKAKSCGCLKREKAFSDHIVHGGRRTRLYNIWTDMKARCLNPEIKQYKDYGGRDITVCTEWLHDFAAFRDWAMSHGYRDDLSIDRIDNDKGYSPDNCRWATRKTQNQNRRPRKTK